MFAQAISSTTPTTAIRTNSGCENWLRRLESPLEAGFMISLWVAAPGILGLPSGSSVRHRASSAEAACGA